MPKVYIAAAFRKFSDREKSDPSSAYGEIVDQSYIDFLERIEDIFLAYGFQTCLPHRDEGLWGKRYYEPAAISTLCLHHVMTSDVIFAIAEHARGVHIELGYAKAIKDFVEFLSASGLPGVSNWTKRLILLHKEGIEPSTLLHAFGSYGEEWFPSDLQQTLDTYKDEDDLLSKARQIVASEYSSAWVGSASTRTKAGLIDIGSHTLKLKIVTFHSGGQPRLDHEAKVSLGIMSDVIETGNFSQQTIQRVVGHIKDWLQICAAHSCSTVKVTGTAALRRARNASDLMSIMDEETGLRIEIMSPEAELLYVYSAVTSNFKSGTELAVLNLGGGSTQVGVGAHSAPKHQFYLDFGTRHLIERWPWNKPMSDQDYSSLRAEVSENVRRVIPEGNARALRLVHTGGELDFLLRCQVQLSLSIFSPTHVSEISVDKFTQFADRFRKLDPGHVARKYGLNPEWAVGAVASNVIALAVAEAVQAEAIIPSNLNVSDGVALLSKSRDLERTPVTNQ